MSGAPEQDRGPIAFGEKLLTVLGEGRKTATYKYAVLLGLMDLCLEQTTRGGSAPGAVRTADLAAKVVQLYWAHTLPFGAPAGRVLSQNQGSQAAILRLIQRFREQHAPDPSATLARARLYAPQAFERLLRDVEWTLVKMPLPKLQRVGSTDHRFLYRIGWDDDVRRGEFGSDDFDGTIRFVGQAGDHLVRLSGLLRPFIQREWTRFVGRLNDDLVPESGLEDFLFGMPRAAMGPIRDDLRMLAEDRCFYCAGPLRDAWDVDHFVPWSRYPDNGLENLVPADSRCNNQKRDHLAAVDHVEKWVERAAKHRDDLRAIAEAHTWDRNPERTAGVAGGIYLRLPSDSRLWHRGREFVPADRRRLREAFGAA